jgi:hypothetical protein
MNHHHNGPERPWRHASTVLAMPPARAWEEHVAQHAPARLRAVNAPLVIVTSSAGTRDRRFRPQPLLRSQRIRVLSRIPFRVFLRLGFLDRFAACC